MSDQPNSDNEDKASSDPPDPSINRATYDAIAARWDRERFRLADDDRRVVEFALRDLTVGACVLDLGCGTGRPIGELMIARGFDITGIDGSPQMLAIARSRLPEARWIEARLEEYVPNRRYDAVLAWDSLFHVPRDFHRAIFERVRNALTPNGRVALTLGGSENPAFTDRMFGKPLYYDSHAPDTALALLRDIGFEIEHSEFLDVPVAGRDKGRFAIVAQPRS